MSDVEAIDAVFGEHRSTLARIEQARINSGDTRGEASPRDQSAGARWGLNPDPQQRVFGLGLLVLSALALIVLLAAKIGC